jgi:hypothetical protein
MRKGSPLTILGGVFGLVGVVLLCVAVVLAVTTRNFLASAARAEGTVIDLRRHTSLDSSGDRMRERTVWSPVVEFTTADGRRLSFEDHGGSNPPAYEVGDRVQVAYDRDDPSHALLATPTAYLASWIVGGVGLVFTAFGALLFVVWWRTARRRSWLRRHGQAVWVEDTRVDRKVNVRINGRHPFVVRATWQDPRTGQTHTATSEYLRQDPGPRLAAQPRVRVLFDPDHPGRSLVDLDAHPTIPEDHNG